MCFPVISTGRACQLRGLVSVRLLFSLLFSPPFFLLLLPPHSSASSASPVSSASSPFSPRPVLPFDTRPSPTTRPRSSERSRRRERINESLLLCTFRRALCAARASLLTLLTFYRARFFFAGEETLCLLGGGGGEEARVRASSKKEGILIPFRKILIMKEATSRSRSSGIVRHDN